MTRSELIATLANRFPHLKQTEVESAATAILARMASALSAGSRIELRGFGSFGTNLRAPRIGRNPKTGEQVNVPAKRVVHFKAGLELRERVDKAER